MQAIVFNGAQMPATMTPMFAPSGANPFTMKMAQDAPFTDMEQAEPETVGMNRKRRRRRYR